jgi:hypothetical protein
MTAPAIARAALGDAHREEWERAWAQALDALELEVDRAEALLVAGAPPAAEPAARTAWVAPVVQGPMPESLQARAEAIAVRQQQVAAQLCRAIVLARRELAVAERMDWRLNARTAAFLDADF